MEKYLLPFIAILMAVIVPTIQQCGDHQVYQECGSSCKEYCHWDPRLVLCIEQCNGGCYCEPGYIYETIDSTTCIPEDQCDQIPTCGNNQQYMMCGSACPPYCGQPPDTVCTEQCVQGCFCEPGYILSNEHSAHCIPEGTC